MLSGEWLRSKFHTVLSDEDKTLLSAEYVALFGSSITGKCNDRYNDAIIRILNKHKMTSKYKLKAGFSFIYKGRVYTRLNMTDEAAEWYIKQDLSRRNNFHELAKDWDDYEKPNDYAPRRRPDSIPEV